MKKGKCLKKVGKYVVNNGGSDCFCLWVFRVLVWFFLGDLVCFFFFMYFCVVFLGGFCFLFFFVGI